MKVRAYAMIDYELTGGFKEAALEEAKLDLAMFDLVRSSPRAVHYQVAIRERRGNNRPDLKNMKFRRS